MFSRIYIGMFISVLVAAALSYALYYFSSQERLRNYEASLVGTMQLISEELHRQPVEKHARYLELVSLLLGAEIQSFERQQWLAQYGRTHDDLAPAPKQVVNISHLRQHIVWLLAVGEKTLVEVRLEHLAEQQFRAQAVLLVSELSRNKQPADASVLQPYSVFPVSLPLLEQLKLDAQQLSRLKRGAVVVDYDSADNNRFTVYAPMPKQKQVVALGPIPQFDALPLSIVLGMLALTGLVMVAVSYWLVSRLEMRLKQISGMVSAFGRGDLQARVQTEGQDAIALLGAKINGMATRIETLLQSQRDITQAVSHELRTPLARIRFRLGLLDEEADSSAIADKTNAIRNDLGELEQLIDEVLEHHKLTQLPDLPMEQVDMKAMLNRVVKQVQEAYPASCIEIDEVADKPLLAHAASLERMLANLISNACKHGDERVQLSYLYESNDGVAALKVDDDGRGIAPEERERIFDPFYQLDSSRNKRKAGYGLGLAIVQRIVSLHGASIEISDSSLGGARFRVLFPSPVSADAGGLE